MLIRHSNDGKLYLYDVIEVKKETSNPLELGERYPVTRIWCNAPTKIAQPSDILISMSAPTGAVIYDEYKHYPKVKRIILVNNPGIMVMVLKKLHKKTEMNYNNYDRKEI